MLRMFWLSKNVSASEVGLCSSPTHPNNVIDSDDDLKGSGGLHEGLSTADTHKRSRFLESRYLQ
jgi:hypothetical protein